MDIFSTKQYKYEIMKTIFNSLLYLIELFFTGFDEPNENEVEDRIY
jgi:hypothetical protein